MYTGMLYNTFVCFVTGFTSLLVFLLLHRARTERKEQYHEGLDYFTLFLGVMWILVGLRTLFSWLGRSDIDILIFKYLTGPFTYIHVVPLFYYFGWSFFKNKKLRSLFNGFMTLMVLLVLFTFFKNGFTTGKLTNWGIDPAPNDLTNKIFTFGIFLPVFILIIVEFIRRLRNWRRSGSPIDRKLFGFSIGFLIYVVMGILDALGGTAGWSMLVLRSGIMLAPLVFYLFATWGIED